MTENIYGEYGDAIAYLKDKADGGRQRREDDSRAVDTLLELSKQKPQQQPETDNPLVNEMLRQVRR